ncbi:MAG: methyltransferase domain-containing protein [Trueperaceae bacterium]|nr:methyltransferase domain-containing protein [Trueperaceae bacterium]
MPLVLRRRAEEVLEHMDDPACDRQRLENTYANFRWVNGWFAAWHRVYRDYLRPRLEPHRLNTLLDVGFGGGDVPKRLLRWAERDGLQLAITAIDIDARAIAYARSQPLPPGLGVRHVSTRDLAEQGERFDLVISNHLLHHLNADTLADICDDTRRLAARLVLHNDIARSDLAYLGFALATGPLFPRSFITADGLRSIRRSYTAAELARAAPEGWTVDTVAPYRLLLTYTHDA